MNSKLEKLFQNKVKGKVVLITGASSGIGLTAAHKLADAGAHVLLVARTKDTLDEVKAEIEAKELARIIESFLDTLTTENRVIFMRRYWFSDSYKDIAEVVGLSEKNVSVRLTRIREKMKQYLIEREVFV